MFEEVQARVDVLVCVCVCVLVAITYATLHEQTSDGMKRTERSKASIFVLIKMRSAGKGVNTRTLRGGGAKVEVQWVWNLHRHLLIL